MGGMYEIVENNCFFLIVMRGVWKKENDLKHCKWNFQIDTGFQIR